MLDPVSYRRRSKDRVVAANGDCRVDNGLDDRAAKKIEQGVRRVCEGTGKGMETVPGSGEGLTTRK